MHKEIILYERVQAEYDCFIEELLALNQEQQSSRIHELRIKTVVLELIVNEMYTDSELEYLLLQDEPLRVLYEMFIKFI
ncbi:DUF3848 domain-containing protein [Turicibacter sanguinis]|uniref:DUF3848 domain-containing protein n=1 Tax=Turicibacter sanguinis TaxID=154288 RepID=A0A9X4XH27_9FIRM|nr:DUF3848 domain-containing protein [Phocaeicola vulgatus]MTK21655.1 DUF3848 domain-containing protein [Turicibacter sanguinis]MTK73135.1 DUF3848 domain-containing protein [Turicibacter sanguinis]